MLAAADSLHQAETAQRDLAWQIGGGFERAAEPGVKRAELVRAARGWVQRVIDAGTVAAE